MLALSPTTPTGRYRLRRYLLTDGGKMVWADIQQSIFAGKKLYHTFRGFYVRHFRCSRKHRFPHRWNKNSGGDVKSMLL